ncbi:penicillin-binding transpeptidase domain-containing protein [Rhodococcus sp. X156]|uniref:penicillin-binding transpeptidase domain-containing protein n=1 Tax=Rhodococcus sp. X156 TaxID=2499145 RepID=UPI000FDCAD48|nr:penicillin-binding transpeptidase domain-containing protein [Rhodococcus sp. X156]
MVTVSARPRTLAGPRLLAAVLLAVLMVTGSLTACTSGPSAADAASRFLQGLSAGDLAAAGAATDQPDAARAAIETTRTGLGAESVDTELGEVRTSDGTATADFTAHWHLAQQRTWTHTGQLKLGRTGGDWTVRWSSANLHPRLADNQSLAVRADPAPTASVLDRNGQALLNPGVVVRVTLDPAAAGDVPAVARDLAAAVSRFDPAITTQSIMDGVATGGAAPYPVVTLRENDYLAVKAAIYELPGVSFSSQAALLSVDPTVAPTLLREVSSTVQDDLAGRAGWRVVTVGPNGAQVETLATTAAEPAAAVRLTLDHGVQQAAQNAVRSKPEPAMTVALKASTGEVLAVAQNAAADAAGPVALTGLYEPGSTFKTVTAAAVLQAGTVTAETPSACPATTVVGGVRVIPNYNDFALGEVPLRTAFAASCNTTFAQLSGALGADALSTTARSLGIGMDYTAAGMTTVTGKVPPTADLVKRAEDSIGQGDVQASPFGMALVAATVARGTTPAPVLVQGAPTAVAGSAPALPAPVLDQLRVMMREVVTGGSGRGVAEQGQVHGKTGEAQFGDGTRSHSWFIGYRGDVAFATLVVGGGSSAGAVGVTGQVLAALPAGY